MRKIFFAVAGSVALMLGLAAPALADGSPSTTQVMVNGTLGATLTVTGINATINLPPLVPSTTVTATAAETYTISTNSPGGYTFSITGPGNGLTDGNGHQTGPGSVSVAEKVKGTGGTFDAAGDPLVINTTSAPNGTADSYREDWSVAVPAGLAPGNYTGAYNYVITAK